MLSKPKTRQPLRKFKNEYCNFYNANFDFLVLANVSNSMGRYSDGREYRIRAPLTPVTYQAIKPSKIYFRKKVQNFLSTYLIFAKQKC